MIVSIPLRSALRRKQTAEECQLPVASFPFYNLYALLSSLLSVRVLPEIVRFGWHTNGSRQSSQTIQNRHWLGPEIDPQKAQRPTRLECAAGRELLHRVARRGKANAFARRPHRFPGAGGATPQAGGTRSDGGRHPPALQAALAHPGAGTHAAVRIDPALPRSDRHTEEAQHLPQVRRRIDAL